MIWYCVKITERIIATWTGNVSISNIKTVQYWNIVAIQDYVQTIKWCHYQ